MTAYSEKLRDPRWQKMRLEILQRDDWVCQICCDSKSTLNVHHRYYIHGRDPWDYPEDSLVTLCESCHEKEGDLAEAFESDLIKILRAAGAFNSNLGDISSVFINARFNEYEWSVLLLHLSKVVEDFVVNGGLWNKLCETAASEWHEKVKGISKT